MLRPGPTAGTLSDTHSLMLSVKNTRNLYLSNLKNVVGSHFTDFPFLPTSQSLPSRWTTQLNIRVLHIWDSWELGRLRVFTQNEVWHPEEDIGGHTSSTILNLSTISFTRILWCYVVENLHTSGSLVIVIATILICNWQKIIEGDLADRFTVAFVTWPAKI